MKDNSYEGIFIIRPDIKAEEEISKIKSMIESEGCASKGMDLWPRREFAYPIKKYREGVYMFFRFSGPSQSVQKILSKCSIDENILRTAIFKDYGFPTPSQFDTAAVASQPQEPVQTSK